MFSRLTSLSLGLILALSIPLSAKNDKKNVLDIKHSISDSSVVFPESFENDVQRLLDGWYLKNYTSADPEAGDRGNPSVSDEIIRSRLAQLPTVIEMPFNQIVRLYIDRYLENSRPQVSAILGLSNYYMPIFEQALEERGLPLELKYLPVIESGLDPNAVSKHGAAGLWQFMIATANGMGLEVSSLVDERRDPYASSRAAADYLKSLHDAYSDWNLAIAAYNCGPSAVNKAIRRAGADEGRKDFWTIYDQLSPETRGYVPMFIAANYVMNHYTDHGISPVLPTKPLVTDTIGISERVHFDQISAVLDIPVEELRLLNPQYRADVIPGSPEKMYTLILPSRQVQAYIMSHDEILDYQAEKYSRRDQAEPGDTPEGVEPEIVISQSALALSATSMPDDGYPLDTDRDAPDAQSKKAAPAPASNTVVHKVQPGETLASIASQYGVTPAEIRTLNHLRRNAVRAGQQLKIQAARNTAQKTATPPQKTQPQQTAQTTTQSQKNKGAIKQQSAQTKTKPKEKTSKKATTTDHTLKSGESLSSLSKKYGVSIDEIKAANGMKNDNLRAGDNIKIPAKSASASKSKTGKGSKASAPQPSTGKKKSKKKRR